MIVSDCQISACKSLLRNDHRQTCDCTPIERFGVVIWSPAELSIKLAPGHSLNGSKLWLFDLG
jgi:hypothetical protein